MFTRRAYLLDVSRCKVPTRATLQLLVDVLARFGYNELQLYAVPSLENVRAKRLFPLSLEACHELALYCQMNGLDLVPAWNLLPLASQADAAFWTALDAAWRTVLPAFESNALTFALEGPPEDVDPFLSAAALKPPALAAFIKEVARCACRLGKRPMCAGNLVLETPGLLRELPPELILLACAHTREKPLVRTVVDYRVSGRAFYVCGGTQAWQSLAGRMEDMRTNLEDVEHAARQFGARGYLVADWADKGCWQPLAASLPGIILGGSFANDGASAAKMNLEEALDAVMGVPLGGTLLRLGTLYLRGGVRHTGASELYRILAHDRGYSRAPELTDHVLAEIAALAEGCRHTASTYASATLYGAGAVWAEEIMYMANLVDAACNRRDEKRLKFLREDHARIWRMRNREEGLRESQTRLPRF